MFGTVRQLGDGRVALRFERTFAHPRDKVWRALTEAGRLRRWFVEIIDYDRSTLEFTTGAALEYVARDGTVAGKGTVVAAEPPARLEYTWDDEILRWELFEDNTDGTGTRLVFTNELSDPDAVAALDEGWAAGLTRLADALDL